MFQASVRVSVKQTSLAHTFCMGCRAISICIRCSFSNWLTAFNSIALAVTVCQLQKDVIRVREAQTKNKLESYSYISTDKTNPSCFFYILWNYWKTPHFRLRLPYLMEILENSIFLVTGQRLDWHGSKPKLFSSGWFTVLNSRYKIFLVLWWFIFSMNSFQICYKLTQNVPMQAWKIMNFRRLSSELLRSSSELTETLRSWYEESTIDPWFFTTILWCFFNILSRW